MSIAGTPQEGAGVPSGVVGRRFESTAATFLFTDIEGSTRLLDQLGERYRDLLAQHHHLVREAITAYGGQEIGTAGDSFFAAFSSAADAVECAQRMQRELAARKWPGGEVLRVRIGIHTGAATLEAGALVGIDVHRAARVMSVAHGGQVLLTDETRRAVGSSVELRDLGSHRLKDLRAPEHLFQLTACGLEDSFPPLRSLNRSNLPIPPSQLIGREQEVSDALGLLALDEMRLLTLWGPGGSGKTRLALEVAAEAVGRYRDGVWLVMLAAIPDRALMVSEIARALDVDSVPGEPLEQTVVRALATRELLLLLDNFEHLLEAADVVADLLAGAPRLDVLATSREPLRIRGEQRMEGPPLRAEDAVELFLARARAVRADLSLDEEGRAAIERICARLDGLPLAVELAAARVAVFTPRRLEQRVAERLSLPEGPRDLPERQRTLRATIDWSYRLLDPPERTLFASLSPFIGGVRIDSAESVWGADASEHLISLADKSLLRRREDPDGEPRLWMLETVREFAVERALADHVADAASDRHAEYFFKFVEQAAPLLHGREQRRWLDRLEHEHANLRTALDHLIVRSPERAVRMAGDLAWFWDHRGYRLEAIRRLDEALGLAPHDCVGRAGALLATGRFRLQLAPAAEAKSLLLEALSVARREGQQRVVVLALVYLGWAERYSRNETGSIARHAEAIAAARSAGDDWALALALNNYCVQPWLRADPQRARSMLEEALVLFRRVGDMAGIAVTSDTLMELALDAGEIELAEALNDESLARAREIDFRPAIADALVARAVMSLLRDDADSAETDLQAATQTSLPYTPEGAALTLSAAATIAAIRQAPARAAMLWAAAEQARLRVGELEYSGASRLRARWQPEAEAAARNQADWDAAWQAGTELSVEDALGLATAREVTPSTTGSAPAGNWC